MDRLGRISEVALSVIAIALPIVMILVPGGAVAGVDEGDLGGLTRKAEKQLTKVPC